MRAFLWTSISLLTLTLHAVDADKKASVKPADDFDPEEDAKVLRKAMKGLVTDAAAIIGILAHRSNAQRQEIKSKFPQAYGKDLVDELKGDLGGKFEKVILALMQKPAVYDARSLWKAMRGAVTDDSTLIEIMCTRKNDELTAINQAYTSEFDRDLDGDVTSETFGPFQRLLRAMCSASRDESNEVDEGQAKRDAEDLYDAAMTIGETDEATFTRILATRNFNLLGEIFRSYEKFADEDILATIMGEFEGSLMKGYLTIAKGAMDTPGLFAERLYKSMKGLGTDDKTLIRIVVTRSEIDMEDIKTRYEEMYGNTLMKDIKRDCAGDYEKLLIALVGE